MMDWLPLDWKTQPLIHYWLKGDGDLVVIMVKEDVLIIMILLDWGVVPCNRHPYNIGSSPHVARQLKTIYSEQDMVVSILNGGTSTDYQIWCIKYLYVSQS